MNTNSEIGTLALRASSQARQLVSAFKSQAGQPAIGWMKNLLATTHQLADCGEQVKTAQEDEAVRDAQTVATMLWDECSEDTIQRAVDDVESDEDDGLETKYPPMGEFFKIEIDYLEKFATTMERFFGSN